MRLLAICFWLCFAVPLAAQEQSESPSSDAVVSRQQLDLARRFVTVGGSEAMFAHVAVAGFEAALPTHGVNLNARQLAALRPVVDAAFQEPARIFVNELSDYIASASSPKDLVAALEYYESEAGQRFATVAVELATAISLYGASGGLSSLPVVPDDATLSESQRTHVMALARALSPRLTALEVERLAAANIDSTEFVNFMSRFIVSRLSAADLDAAIEWAESPASMRLEGASAERTAAVEVATLRAMRSLDIEPIREALKRVRRENPT